ncbi:MAG: hypothetical protein AVDCRST_MAG20-2538, partial [uncultured Acidimicrobiales bacterium]
GPHRTRAGGARAGALLVAAARAEGSCHPRAVGSVVDPLLQAAGVVGGVVRRAGPRPARRAPGPPGPGPAPAHPLRRPCRRRTAPRPM